jgi:hypothetical protein
MLLSHSLSLTAGACLATLVSMAPAGANDLTLPRPLAADRCAGLGEGYVPVQGSETCVKIGGHVRVEYGGGNTLFDEPARRAPEGYGGGFPMPNASDGAMRTHLRLNGPRR